MFIVIVKLLEVMARAGFVVGVTYTLPLEPAGQFGMIVTLAGLFSFMLGWERHVDIQRRMVGETPATFDRAMADALHLYAFNYVVMLPVYAAAMWWWANLGWDGIALTVIIVLAEQIANQVYQISLVNPRFHFMLWIVAARNLALLGLVAVPILFWPSQMTLEYVLTCWTIVSGLSVVAVAIAWRRMSQHTPHQSGFNWRDRIFRQHKASLTHFLIGLVAILILQFDRLAVGGMLSLKDVGVYFRHILLVSVIYQFVNIASYNRIVPVIFANAKTESKSALKHRTRSELFKAWGGVALLIGGLWLVNWLSGEWLFARYALEWPLVLLLIVGATVRVCADFNALILHARMREQTVLMSQIVAFTAGGALLIWMTWMFHTKGAAAAMIFSAALYLILTARAVHLLPERPNDD